MRKYDNVDIEIIKLGDNRAVEASGDETTQSQLCGSCQNETGEDPV